MNISALESSSNDDDEDLIKIKRNRKNKKQNVAASKKVRVDQILEAHKLNSQLSKTDTIADNVDVNSSVRDEEECDDGGDDLEVIPDTNEEDLYDETVHEGRKQEIEDIN